MNNNFLQEVPAKITDYFRGALFVGSFLASESSELSAKKSKKIFTQLYTDMFKCVILSNIIFITFRFSKGRQHPFRYVISTFKGTAFGIGYSMFYLDRKLENFLAEERVGERLC